MKITRISLFQAEVPLVWGLSRPLGPDYDWKWSQGRVVPKTLIHMFTKVDTDEGVSGIGEIDIYGSNYIDAFVGGVQPGITELAVALLGKNPLQLDSIDRLMDSTLTGHRYVKQPLDMACWDILGKSAGMPLVDLWGGRVDQPVPCLGMVPRMEPQDMQEELVAAQDLGYRNFQVKLGIASIEEDIAVIRAAAEVMRSDSIFAADGNEAFTVDRALQISRACKDVDFYWEQPCRTLEELRALSRLCSHPILMDEGAITVQDILRAYTDGVIQGLVLKVSRVGGMTKSKKLRDLCVGLGIPLMRIEDAWGSAISTAATTHLAQSTPSALCYGTLDARSHNGVQTGYGMAEAVNCTVVAPEKPGLGMELNMDVMELVDQFPEE